MAVFTAAGPLLMTVVQPPQQALFSGIKEASYTTVGFVGSIVAGILPRAIANVLGVAATSELAYRNALFGVCGFGLLSVLPLIGLHKAKQRVLDAPIVTQEMVRAGSHIPFYKLFVSATASLFFGIGYGMFVPFQTLYFRQQFGVSDSIVGYSIAVGLLASGIGSILCEPSAKRFGIRRASSLSGLLVGLFMFAMLIPNFYVVSVAYDFSRMMVGLTVPLFWTLLIQSVPPKQHGTATSICLTLFYLGIAGASMISGYMQVGGSFNIVIIVAGLGHLVSAALIQYIAYTDKLPE